MATHLWQLASRSLAWTDRPLVMGILNVTPDSFSDGNQFLDPDRAVARALELEQEGADILDLGGESTRPGAEPVAEEEELRRVMPVIERLVGTLRIPISIDTTKAVVAEAALRGGVEIVNDVSGGEWDADLWPLVASRHAGYVLTHCQGRPPTMQQHPVYHDVVTEVLDYLRHRLDYAEESGIPRQRVVCDVGFGFGKTFEHNKALLTRLGVFGELGRPLLVGISRKSFIKKLGGEAQLSLCTELVHAWSAAQGAALWRVHDVKTAAAAARIVGTLRESD